MVLPSGDLCPTLTAMLAEATLLVALTVVHGVGAEACLAEPRLKKNVEKRLRRRVFVDPARAQLRLTVTYVARGAETEARIEMSRVDGAASGTRTLATSSHCSALDDSLSLSVALLVDQPPEPEPVEEPVVGSAAPALDAPAPPVAPRPMPAVITIPADVAAPREPWHVAVGAALQGSVGVLPGVAPALTLSIGVWPRQLVPVFLSGEGFTSRRIFRDETSGARFRLLRVGLSLCPRLTESADRSLALCFGQKVGWLRVDGFGFDHDLAERRLTFALHVGAEGRHRLFSTVSVRGAVGAEVPLVRDRFVSSGHDAADLFRASPVGLVAQVGVEALIR